MANTMLPEYEGDPAFDIQYAVAAIETFHLEEGVFALERVLLVEPDNQLARLELARGYYQQRKFDQAAAMFNAVKTKNPPPRVLTRIDRYLALIEKRRVNRFTRVQGFIELYAGYDSNVNSAPGSQLTRVVLSDDALGRGDSFMALKAGVDVEHRYAEDRSLIFESRLDIRYYDTEEAQDNSNLTLKVGHRWYEGKNQYQLNAVRQDYRLDEDGYRDLMGLSVDWNRQLSNRSLLRSYLAVNDLEYASSEWRDSRQYSLGSNYLYAGEGNWKPVYVLGGFIGNEKPDEPGTLADGDVDRNFYGVSLGVQLTPLQDLTLMPSLVYQVSEYAGDHWIYNVKRKDKYAALNLNMNWRFKPDWSLLANYSYADSDSNIELNDFRREQINFGLRRDFK
ncbi:porin family protein [Aliamphritea hakodatensis]|uniref:porin family protein n=1 Tax=Aliamphritea hakodatensis TaxID=2895352 RepID=UPI0022FDAA94|nr:porin family protein [Aliamphritea hakodatensis]